MKMILLMIFSFSLVGCTVSFQNISTHGTAEDLVDEEQGTNPTVSPTVNAPISAVPQIPFLSK